jgi:uncharacterized membrane protein YdbT with pleckstrin-like domain
MSSLLSKTSTEARLEDIQSVKTKMGGIIGSLFNYGDVLIETAAENIKDKLEKQVDKIESEIIKFIMKTPDGAKLY